MNRLERDPFQAYKFKFTKYERGYLTADELQEPERKLSPDNVEKYNRMEARCKH